MMGFLFYGMMTSGESWKNTTLTAGWLKYDEAISTVNGSVKYIWQQVNILAGHQELSLSGITSYHGLAMSTIFIRCRKSYNKEQWMVVITEEDHVNHGRTPLRNGQASWCHHCCTSWMTEFDGQSSQQTLLSEYSNDAWASRELVNYSMFPCMWHNVYFNWNLPYTHHTCNACDICFCSECRHISVWSQYSVYRWSAGMLCSDWRWGVVLLSETPNANVDVHRRLRRHEMIF